MTSILERIQSPEVEAHSGDSKLGRVVLRWDDDGVELVRSVGWRKAKTELLPLTRLRSMQLSRSQRQVPAPWLERLVKGDRAEPRTVQSVFASLRSVNRDEQLERLELCAQISAPELELDELVEHAHHEAAEVEADSLLELLTFLYQRDIAVAYAAASAHEAHAGEVPPPVRVRTPDEAPAAARREGPKGPGIEIDLDDNGVDVEGLRFSDGLAPYRKRKHWGYVDRHGEWMIEPTFSDARPFLRGRACVAVEGEWGVIDPAGTWLVAAAWQDIGEVSENRVAVRSEGLWGYLHEDEGLFIEPAFDAAEPFSGGRAAVRVANRWGLIDVSGSWLVKPLFDDIDARGQRVYLTLGDDSMFFDLGERQIFVHGRRQELPMRFKRHGRYGFIAPDLTLLSDARFDDAHPFRGLRAAVQEDGKWGYLDLSGNLVVRPRFDDLMATEERLTPIKAGGLWGFFSPGDDRFAIEPRFDTVEPFSDGIAPVAVGGKWGFMNARTTEVTEPRFDAIRAFRRGLAPVGLGSRWGLVDERGRVVVEPLFDDARVVERHPELRLGDRWLEFLVDQRRARYDNAPLAAPLSFSRGELYGFVQPDLSGVIEPRFDAVQPFRAGFAAVCEGGRWGYIEASGAWHIEPMFAEARAGDFGAEVELDGELLLLDVTERRLRRAPFVDESFFLRVEEEGHFGFLDCFLTRVTEPIYAQARKPVGSHAAVADDAGRWGLVDRHGREVVAPRYEDLGEVAEDAVPFCEGGRWGLLDLRGERLIEPRFEGMGRLREGLIAARQGGRWGYVSRGGEERVGFRYDEARAFHSGRAGVRKGKAWGVTDAQGQELRSPSLEALFDYRGERAAACERGQWGFLDAAGAWSVKPSFQEAKLTDAGFVMVRQGADIWGHIDEEGAFQVGPPVDEIDRFVEGYARARRGERWGLLYEGGQWQVEPLFDALVRKGRALYGTVGDLEVRVEARQRCLANAHGEALRLPQRFRKAGRAGFVLPDLSRVIEPRFEDAHAFTDVGLAGVCVGGVWGFIDVSGRVVIPPRFDAIRDFSRGMAAVELGGLWGFINERGVVVIEPRFEAARDFHTRLAQVQVEGVWNFIDRFGNFVRET